eukprot:6186980-Pleurochrysis_carterae.AAC.1
MSALLLHAFKGLEECQRCCSMPLKARRATTPQTETHSTDGTLPLLPSPAKKVIGPKTAPTGTGSYAASNGKPLNSKKAGDAANMLTKPSPPKPKKFLE